MKRIVALCLASLIVPVFASAQDADINTTVNFVIANPSYAGCDDPAYQYDADSPQCADLSSVDAGGFKALWILVNRDPAWANGIGAVQLGVQHQGLVFGGAWTLCTGGSQIPQDDAFGAWPESDTGNAITWPGGCYIPPGGTARVGFVPLGDSAAGEIRITQDPRLGPTAEVSYTDCDATLFRVPAANWANVTLANPIMPLCGPQDGVPTEEHTWSSIKHQF